MQFGNGNRERGRVSRTAARGAPRARPGDDAYASVCASGRPRRPSTVIHAAPADRSDEARLHRIQRRTDSLTQPSSGKNETPERNVGDSAQGPADGTGQASEGPSLGWHGGV